MTNPLTQLPSFLHRTPEQINDEMARQSILRGFHLKGARQNAAEIKIGQAMVAEQAIRANLKLIMKSREPEVYRETRLQLAESLANQGKFRQATNVAEKLDQEYARHYRRLAKAVDRDDSETCDCATKTITADERNARGQAVTTEIEVPNEYVAAEVFSEKHGKIMPVVVCAICGKRNVRDLPEKLAKIKSAAENLTDIEILK